MSTIKSSAENLTLNADGANNDIKFQSNGSEVASIDQAGLLTTAAANITGAVDNTISGTLVVKGGLSANQTSGLALFQQNSTHSTIKAFGADATTTGILNTYVAASDGSPDTLVTSVTADGLTFFGDTAAANALDDYEEGSWTPALRGSATAGNTTYTSQYGFYEKIGRTVHFRGSLHVASQGTLDGIVYVTGLPFTSNSTTQRSTVHFGYTDNLSVTPSESLTGTVDGGDTEFLIRIWNSSNGTSNFDDAEMGNGSEWYFSGTYYV